jgi:predicted glycogen debranching enzyme
MGTNDYGGTIYPNGNHYMTGFVKNIFPEFTYEAGQVKLKKTIAMLHGENTVLIVYDVLEAASSFNFELLPLLSVRGYHSLMYSNDTISNTVDFSNHVFRTKSI